MEITKRELKKISKKFRNLANNVMNAYFREQKEKLYELMIFVDETALLHDYLDSLSYEIEDLEGCLKDINSSYGHKCLNQGTDAKKRTYLLYRTFLHICDSDLKTLNFGWYYANSTKFQDMAKAFGDRLIYPFVEEINEYLEDIAIEMGYDENNSIYNIDAHGGAIQVNISEKGSSLHAEQVIKCDHVELNNAINNVEQLINDLDDSCTKALLKNNLESIKNELSEKKPSKKLVKNALETMFTVAKMIADVPAIINGIKTIASIFGINLL